jgi:glycosyltransferase involved in cell wall biosynthesis
MFHMKRILLIGDPDSLWIRRYIENVLHPAGWETVVYPIYGWKGAWREEYARMHVTVDAGGRNLPVLRHIPKVRMWTGIHANAAALSKLGPFDAVHCHYLSVADLALGCEMAKRHGAPLTATFWGSDLLRAEPSVLRRMEKYLARCTAVTVFNREHKERIRALYGDKLAEKTHVLDFGEGVFPPIDRVLAEGGHAAAKAHFGIAPERLTVAIGSSASRAQQQLEALRGLGQLDKAFLQRVTVLLQHTYAHDDPAYEAEVRTLAESLPGECVVLTDFMNDEESAYLRCAADVYLHTIRTDAFSSSMKEYLYAGARVAYGSWLTYPALQELELPVRSFDRFEDLPALVQDAFNGDWQPLDEAARQRLGSVCTWESLAKQWLALYER